MKKILGYICIGLGVLIIFFVIYAHSPFYNLTRPFSYYTILTSSWDLYKKQFLNSDGRIIDNSQKGITTSEGQSYALLRSVWMGDSQTFVRVWKFTKENMRRPNDHLFGWRWGKNSSKTYGFLSGGGNNSATDADEDIAMSLIFANRRWHESVYLSEVKNILSDIWTEETATVSGKRYLTGGNWADRKTDVIVNPSYFNPGAWRIFASVDSKHQWKSLIKPAYDLLREAGKAPMDKKKAIGLPPDWLAIDKKSDKIEAASISGFTTNYSYDAMRVPWRIALDYQWNHDSDANSYLQISFTQLIKEYGKNGKLAGIYAHDGSVVTTTENPVMYATIVGLFNIVKPELAKKMYQEKILKLYINDENTFNRDLGYYEQNWLWLGVGLYNKYLIQF